jgi:hypothetical protein
MMDDKIVNRVANSALQSFDLEQYYQPGERALIDIKDQLYQGLIIKENDFRDFIKTNNWSAYKDKYVAIHCSADAIIPTWAYMLITVALSPYANRILFGTLNDLEELLFHEALSAVDWSDYKDAKVVIKGCSKVDVPVSAYVEATSKLQPIVSSLMFGEPCSTVPVFKRRK